MTDQQVIEHLAKVMGWPDSQTMVAVQLPSGNRGWRDRRHWNPLIKDHDAMQVVDAMLKKGWSYELRGDMVRKGMTEMTIWHQHLLKVHVIDSSRARAICIAAAEATKEDAHD